MKTRDLGHAELKIAPLGIGCASLAGIFNPVSDQQARATIAAGLAAGIGYFDTAPFYGLGRAEHLLGDMLRDHRPRPLLSTKAGRLLKPYHGAERRRDNWADPFPFAAIYDYSYDGIMRSFEDSLQRLGLAEIDILYVHDIGTMIHGADAGATHWMHLAEGGYRALQDLKSAGLVKAIGLGVNETAVLMDALALGAWDVFLLAGRYTLLEQSALVPLLSACQDRGVSVVCGGPFNGGALMGTGTWNYAQAPDAIIDRVRALEVVCAEFGVPLGAAALQFPAAHPAICTVLPGPRSPEEFEGIWRWWHFQIPADFWSALVHRNLVSESAPLPDVPSRSTR